MLLPPTAPPAAPPGPEPMDVDIKQPIEKQRKTGRCLAASEATQDTSNAALATSCRDDLPPHLDTFIALDCNLSNVSPDSGIQSVNGSPLHQVMSSPHHQQHHNHHSPLYPTTSRAATDITSHLPPYSPQDSPPPPVLHPAITPPHLASSPHRRPYDDNPTSPEMPVLKCQVEPPPSWLFLGSSVMKPFVAEVPPRPVPYPTPPLQPTRATVLPQLSPQEQVSETEDTASKTPEAAPADDVADNFDVQDQSATLNRGPGRPEDEPRKRPRGRPKGSKNKKTLLAENSCTEISYSSQDNLRGSPTNDLESNVVDNRYLSAVPKCETKDLCIKETNIRDEYNTVSDASDTRADGAPHDQLTATDTQLSSHNKSAVSSAPDTSSIHSNAIPKTCVDAVTDVTNNFEHLPIQTRTRTPTQLSSCLPKTDSSFGKVKRSVGRPRKVPKVNTNTSKEDSVSLPLLNNNKTFSDHIVHKIINEKVRNSEKSDKLSVHEYSADEGGGESSSKCGGDASSQKNVAASLHTSQPAQMETKASKVKNLQRRGTRTEGIPLEDRKKKRGRRKELPAIFRKVYGTLVGDTSSWSKPDKSHPATKPSIPLPTQSESIPSANTSKSLQKRKKKKLKQFKSKHKNIIDPAFVAALEDLLLGLEECHISLPGECSQDAAAVGATPSIFRVKKGALLLQTSKKRRAADKRTSDRESGTEGENSKEKLSGKRKKKLQEIPKEVRCAAVCYLFIYSFNVICCFVRCSLGTIST